MADGNGTAPAQVTQPDGIFAERYPGDRISLRIEGVKALAVVAQCALDDPPHGGPTEKVWESLWYFVGMNMQDMERDLIELQQDARKAAAD